MILEISVSVFIIIVICFIRQWYLKPKRTMEIYAEKLRSIGYNVLLNPYNILYNHFDKLLLKNARVQGDVYKTIKEEYCKYDVVISNILTTPYIQIFNPDLIKHYFAVDKHYAFPKAPLQSVTRIVGQGLFAVEGQVWKRKRRILNKMFNFQFIKLKTETIALICDLCIKDVQNTLPILIDEKTEERYLQMNIIDIFVKVSSEVIFKLFLGIKTEDKIQGKPIPFFLVQLIDDSVLTDYELSSLIFSPKIVNLGFKSSHRSINRRKKLYKNWAMKQIRKKIEKVESQLQTNPEKKQAADIVEALMIEKKTSSQSITEAEQIFNELSAFLFAGTDTTSHFLQMMVYFIANNPEVEEKARKEISKFISSDDYSYQNLKNLTYIDDIQKQTNRLYGPGILLFLRRAKEDNMLGQIPIRKNTLMTILWKVNELSEKYFVEPYKFRPERWQKECDNLPNYISLPFSGGARTCIGKQLALVQSKIALVKFLKRYKKIILPKKDIKLGIKFLPTPEEFKTKLVLNN